MIVIKFQKKANNSYRPKLLVTRMNNIVSVFWLELSLGLINGMFVAAREVIRLREIRDSLRWEVEG